MNAFMCVECEDTQASVTCVQCLDMYCDLCFQAQHRKGSRSKHVKSSLQSYKEIDLPPKNRIDSPNLGLDISGEVIPDLPLPSLLMETFTIQNNQQEGSKKFNKVNENVRQKAKYTPLRLSEEERMLFKLLDASLSVSEYTDMVDILCYRTSTSKRIQSELKELFGVISGMTVASDFRKGRKLIYEKVFHENEEFFQRVFEIGRRYKIMNPDKMRDNYGKMIYLLQDSTLKETRSHLGFTCVRPIQTVEHMLKSCDALEMLDDDLISVASSPVCNGSIYQQQVVQKEKAIDTLIHKYSSTMLNQEVIRTCLASLDDYNSFLESNCGPIEKMIYFLETFFDPKSPRSAEFSLAIQAGRNGARISHSHATQYQYAMQSLLLWKNITQDMYKIWFVVEDDLLCGHTYRLRDTGQGLNRVQRAPSTLTLVHDILSKTQNQVNNWVGSSVIHLGDHNVPNALMFIDKYTQISRILDPIVNVIKELDNLVLNPMIQSYVKREFHNLEKLKQIILSDFFKHGFDGSGAENFFDAGSCIDGRLTSAWNWCSKIEKKNYYPVFLMAGFIGFDGSFSK